MAHNVSTLGEVADFGNEIDASNAYQSKLKEIIN